MKKIFLLVLTVILLVPLSITTVTYAEENNSVRQVYEIDTGIIGYPTVTAFIDSSSDLENLLTTDKTPAMVYLRCKMGVELSVVNKNGDTICPLSNALNNVVKGNIIPAFYCEDLDTAEAIADFIDKNGTSDAFIVSGNEEVISRVIFYQDEGGHKSRRAIGGMLEVTDKNESFLELSNKVSTCGARSILCELDDYTYEEIKTLRKDYQLKTMSIYFKVSGEYGAYQAIEYGLEAICTDDYISTIKVFESFNEKTLIRPIIIQAHRGMDVVYNENSLEGIYASSQIGVTTIEIDPRLTKDNVIVLSHDDTVDRETGEEYTGKICDYTLAQLKAMNLCVNTKASVSKFCTLEEVFQMYREKGLTTLLALDAKETNEVYIDILYDLIEEYDMWEYIGGIGVADSSQVELYKAKFGEYLSYDRVSTSTVGSLSTMEATLLNWFSVINGSVQTIGHLDPYYTTMVEFPELSRYCKDRGIRLSPYQFDTVELIQFAFYSDFANLSTGNSGYLADFLNGYDIQNTVVKVGDEFTVNGVRTLLNGNTQAKEAEGFIIVDGDKDCILVDGNQISAVKNGTVKVMAYSSFKKGGIAYRVYSRITEINVSQSGTRTDNVIIKANEEPEVVVSSGCSSNVNGNSAYIILSSALVITVSLLLKRKKNNG